MMMTLTIINSNDPPVPIIIDTRPTTIPNADIRMVKIQAQLRPFHSPYATAKYASPIIIRIPPSIMPSIGIIKTIKPSKIEPMPPRIASIAIIITPKGLSLCI